MTIEIQQVKGTELYKRYPRETQPQGCYVWLDARTGKLGAEANGEIGNAVPRSVHDGHVLRWRIPALRAAAAKALLESLVPYAERVVTGYETHWNGQNTVGVYGAAASESIEQIERLCDAQGETDALVVWQASEWFGALGSREKQALEIGIRPSTTDEELDALAAHEVPSARSENVDAIEGLNDYLRELREVLRAAMKAA